MPSFVRRRTTLASLFASLSFLLVPACSSSDDSPSGSRPEPETNDDAGVESDDVVVVRFVNRWGFSDNAPAERANRFGTYSPTIIANVDGKEVTFQPNVRDDGAFVFTGVPRAPYILESRFTSNTAIAGDPVRFVRYPIDGRRNIEFGDDYWARPDATVMTADTKLALTLQAPKGIEDGDTFSWIGLHSYFYRAETFSEGESEGIENPPAAGATSTQDWTFDASVLDLPYGDDASGLPSAAGKDDLILLQDRTVRESTPSDPTDPLSRFAPWRRVNSNKVIGVLHAASPDFANGKTNTVSGTLEAPATETFTIDFHGSTFDAVREALGAPEEITRSSARLSLSQEAGPGPAVYTSVSPTAWSIFTSAQPKPIDLSCFPYPESTACDPMECAIGCENARKGYIHPGDLSKFTIEAPRIFATGMRDFFTVSYSYFTEVRLPGGGIHHLTGGVTDYIPRTSSEPSFSLELGPPTGITVDGATIPWAADTIASIPDDHAPVVAFTPATKGAPEYHRVEVIDLTPDIGREHDDARTLTVATLFTHESSVSISMDQLRSGHTYYVRVAAIKDGWKFGERALRSSTHRTTIYSAPFVFGTAPVPPAP